MKQILIKLFSQPKEEGGISDVMRNSRQWQRDLTKDESDWYEWWIKIIKVQRKRVSRNIDRMSGRREMNEFWSNQLKNS